MKKFAVLDLDRKIFFIRNQRVMLDSDLAEIYGVQTKRINEAVKRNSERFPSDFMFQLNNQEFAALRSQFATGSQKHRDPRYLPYAFTEHGSLMLASVLNSSRAVEMSIYIVRAFIRMREELAGNLVMQKRLAEIEKTLLNHDSALRELFAKIKPLLLPPSVPPKPPIGFRAKERN